jgi:hypothetical protein
MFCVLLIMYNRGHGLEDDENRSLRCVRPPLDSAGGATEVLRQPKVPLSAMG